MFMDEWEYFLAVSEQRVPELEENVVMCPTTKTLSILHMEIPRRVLVKNTWSNEDKSQNIKVEYNKCVRMMHVFGTDCVRGMTGYTEGVHCWFVQWPTEIQDYNPVIGVATKQAPLMAPAYVDLVGSTSQSWGWNLYTQRAVHACTPSERYPKLRDKTVRFLVPNKFKMILDMDEGTLSFMAGKKHLGVAHRGLKGKTLYPIVNIMIHLCPVSLTYMGGFKRKPLPLQHLSRLVIRENIKNPRVKDGIRKLDIPDTLKDYLANPKLVYDDDMNDATPM